MLITQWSIILLMLMVVISPTFAKKRYSTKDLIAKAKSMCCPNHRRDEAPMMEKRFASSFLKDDRIAKRFFFHGVFPGITKECCHRACSNEEIMEVHRWGPSRLSNECINESCYTEEIREHC